MGRIVNHADLLELRWLGSTSTMTDGGFTALFLRYRWSGAIGVAWIVNIVMSIDWLCAGFLAASHQLVTYPMGVNWYIINYYVPVIGVTHVMIFARLRNERSHGPQ